MDLSIGGIVRQVTAPVVDAVSLARTGGVDQIASFLRDNPDQRGTIETTLAGSGRTGDLSAIVERAAGTAGTVLGTATQTVNRAVAPVLQAAATTVAAAVQGPAPVVGAATDALARPVATAGEALSRVGTVATQTALAASEGLARPGGPVADVSGRAAGLLADTVTRMPQAADAIGRGLADRALAGPISDLRSVVAPAGGTTESGVQRAADQLGAAIRDGRIAQLIGVAAGEGRLADLIAAARTSGQLPALIAAARSLDGVLAAFASRGGLSATELALFARAGLLSEGDARTLRAAGVPVDLPIDEQDPGLVVPRDGVAEERFDTDTVSVDGMPVAGLPDPALVRFDAGAIRIASRAAVDTYGVLGPPGATVVAANAFEALLRAGEGDVGHVERALGLEAGTLADPDTLIAFVERASLGGLRLPDFVSNVLARPEGVPTALADLARGTAFSELVLGRRAA